ncbi:MAG TPA: twin-arginine translocase TatA/TatE family subunit [Acidimicrobiales bacterium]|nr:twin-arginine translocase TatA/TatE family subunit [Acidimicrobiales bacterium]
MLANVFGVDGVIVIVVVLLLIFGATAIPKLARNLGSAPNEFKKGAGEGGGPATSDSVDGPHKSAG